MTSISPTCNHWSPAAPAEEVACVEAVPADRVSGDVMLATDESELAGNAARVALPLARRHRRGVRVVHVVDTRSVPVPPPLDVAIGMADAVVGSEMHAEQCDAVRATLAAALGGPVDWPVRLGIGAPPSVIVREASHAGAGLVVLGLRRHGVLGRMLDDETALLVMRHAACPVLAVAPGLHELPRHVIAAVDFGRSSRDAARLARTLVAPGGTLTLAYVEGPPLSGRGDGAEHVQELGVRAAFAELRDELADDDDVRIETLTLAGHADRTVAEELLARADAVHADLIALGTRRHGRLERWLLGSVTTDAARDGRVSVLAVPPRPDASPEGG